MESKKLQQLQQANSHLAPQPMPQKKVPPSFHPATGDYRPPHSPVFQNHSQYHNLPSHFTQLNLGQHHQSPSSGSQSTPIDTAPQGHMLIKSSQSAYHQQATGQYGGEQLYQSPPDRTYQMAPARTHYPASISHNHPHPVTSLQQQYQQLQQAKIQAQIQTQNEALAHQQRTFALRQQLNPPIPQSHFHLQSQSQSLVSIPVQSHLQQPLNQMPHRNIPPSTLNLSSQCQPAQGPIKLSNLEPRTQHYHQEVQSQHAIQASKLQSQQAIHQQSQETQQKFHQEKFESTPSDHGPVYIQQNHPGHVVNQACQTQISGAIGSKTKTPTEEQKSPTHQPLDRKKSTGGAQALKSPLTKRPASSPVTLSGWLYKQGSEGLKVWRKRWFVLSEYCLYYYKGPEEEKLLGSILLPSYRVAACSPEDKIYRKYAFKCEHTNMRTYWLAAENAEQMCQWVRALTAATMMQGSSESDQASQPSVSSLNHSGENSDSGIHTFQSQQSKLSVPQGPVTPASDSGGGTQPLYANAPPKPRRINDGGYSSPSPENSIDRCEPIADSRHHPPSQQGKPSAVKSPSVSIQQKTQHHAIYDTRTGNVTSAVRHQNTTDTLPNQFQQMGFDRNLTIGACQTQTKSPFHITDYGKPTTLQQNIPPNYSHEMELEDHIIRAPQRFNDDLRGDIYGERELYMQRAIQQKFQGHLTTGAGITYPNAERRTPDAYGRSKSSQVRPFSDYEDIYNLSQSKMHQNQNSGDMGAYRRPMSPPTYNNEKHVPPMPTRYTPNHLEQANVQQVNMRARPLQSSSMMRPHSADFLEYEARAEAASIKTDPVRAPRPKSSLDINRTPDSYYYSEASYAEKMRQSALYLQKPQSQQSPVVQTYRTPDVSPYSGGMNTISYETSYDRAKRNEILTDPINQGALSVPRMTRSSSKDYRAQQNEQFLRSASARLPRKEEDSSAKDGERKREESMKRLLEWKQRMLQSPLTRKGTQQSNSSIAKLGSASNLLSPHGIQRSRSETHANAGYNSYSSDDEVHGTFGTLLMPSDTPYLASISVQNVRNLPKGNLTVKPEPTNSIDIEQIHKAKSYYTNSYEPSYQNDRNYYTTEADIHNNYDRDSYYPIRKSGSRAEIDLLERETSSQIRNLDMSAGDLLSRTHEELVLLLIQLRRQNSTTARAIEQCCTEIHELQNRIRTSDGPSRSESIQRLDYLKQHLLDLEKQYEKSKPLVNLVDNMVKLGSLYRNNENSRQIQPESVTLDRLEFNQRVQERRLLQEEQKHWDRLSPNHTELQSKVRQLYQLDQLLQEESGTLQNLQRDKEDLERALGGLRARLQDTNGHPVAMEAAKKQQHVLERELARVHQLLAENSKKLEQTVAGNARLEQELLVLRQKLQASRGSRGSQGALGGSQTAGDSIQYASSTTALLESELRRVQQLVGDMQRQRQELSQAVRQLTENSNALYQQIGSKDNSLSSHIKKRQQSSCWTETDLDSMISTDHTINRSTENLNLSTPLYVDTSSGNSSNNLLNCSSSNKLNNYDPKNMRHFRYTDSEGMDNNGMESDDLLENNSFANLTNQERQEIKTVRIVKRESERRHRDRERSANAVVSAQNLDQVLEEDIHSHISDDIYNRSKSLPRSYNETYEAFKQIQDKKQEQPKTLAHTNSNLYISSPSNPLRYSNYFTNSNPANPYPVTMSDKNCNVSSYSGYTIKDKGSTSNYLNTSSISNNSDNTFPLKNKTESIQSLTSPVFQSEAARQIISEMSGSASEDNNEKVPLSHKHKRAVPKEKRRHYTAPNNVNAKAMQNIQAENDMNRNNTNWRAKDDLDMEVALRPRMNAPDVVRSALGQREKISENTIDKLLAAPSKILIPERYIPEKTPELSPEEKKRRQEKVEAIKKMLSEAPINTSNDPVSLPPSKINAEKKQREHLLQLNQILAQQVMQMSKIVAEKAMAALPSKIAELNAATSEEDRSSPTEPLPIYQQRENFFT